jgi:hypothetical protein
MIQDYSQLKAYLVSYAKGDPRIKEVLWGEDKRAHDAQAGRAISPYFWVNGISMIARQMMEGLAAIYYWQLDISIKIATQRQNVIEQEIAMSTSFAIAQDFVQYLQSEANDGTIEFQLSDTSLSPDENFEQDSYYGWDISLRIGQYINCYKYMPGQGRYAVCSQMAEWLGSAGKLAIEIGGTVFQQDWDKESNRPIVLHRLVKDINTSGNNFTAFTDGIYLYVRSTSVSLPLSIDLSPAQNAQAWSGQNCLSGQDGNDSGP